MTITLRGYTAIFYMDSTKFRYDIYHLDGTFSAPEGVIDAMVQEKNSILQTFEMMDCPGYSETAVTKEWEEEVDFDPTGHFDRMIADLRRAVMQRSEFVDPETAWETPLSEDFGNVIVDIKPVNFHFDGDLIVDNKGVVYTHV